MNEIAHQIGLWQADKSFLKIKSLDCHTGGEPLRIITEGFPNLPGASVLEKRAYCQTHYDHLRTALMLEPRGHADMYGVLLVEAERQDSHFGAIFIHNEGYSTMCGHAVIALTKFAVESGLVAQTGPETQVVIDVPCGQIVSTAYADMTNPQRIAQASFNCVPSFVLHQDALIDLPGVGSIRFDLAFGGAFYAYVDVADVGLSCDKKHYNELISMGRNIKAAVAEQFVVSHPELDELGFLYGTIFIETLNDPQVHSRNVCVFADGEVDRSPTGSGVSGRIAIHVAKGDVAVNQKLTIESVLGTRFEVTAIQSLSYNGYEAVIPRVTGRAHISGYNEWVIDPEDDLKDGFMLR